MSPTDISVKQDLTLTQVAKASVASAFFSNVNTTEQAVVKIMAGLEMGLGSISSLQSLHIIKGRITMSANLIAARCKANPKYDYIVKRIDQKGCSIEFYQYEPSGEKLLLGEFSFDEDDRKAASLNGDNWRKYPKAMFFARCISQGVRIHCPDVFFGNTVYTPDELDEHADVDAVVEVVDPASKEEAVEKIQSQLQEDAVEAEVVEVPAKKEKPDLEKAFWNYLEECKRHKERITNRRYYGVLKRHGLERSNGIPKADRQKAKGLGTMQAILNELRAIPDITSNEGFDEEVEHLSALLIEDGWQTKLNSLMDIWLGEGKVFSSAIIPADDRQAIIEELTKLADQFISGKKQAAA